MTRTDVINGIIEARHYTAYVEIGVRNPQDNYDNIRCEHKEGVDVAASSAANLFVGTSDEWFAQEDYENKRDCYFIDGDHSEEQVRKDVRNALRHLAHGGTIIMHDCYPQTEEATAAVKPDNGYAWNGRAYRVFIEARRRKDLQTYCIDCDHGLGIMRRGRSPGADIPEVYPWGTFATNARTWLGLVAAEDWRA